MVKLTAETPLNGTMHIRTGLRHGGLYAPAVVIPTGDRKKLFIMGQARHSRFEPQEYDCFAQQSAQGGIQLPALEISPAMTPLQHFSNSHQIYLVIRGLQNKVLRLEIITKQCSPKRFFLHSTRKLTSDLIEKLRIENERDPAVL